MGQHSAGEELAKLLLDEPGQAGAFAVLRHLTQEGLQVLANDGVEHGVLGVAGPIRGVDTRHVLAYRVPGAAPMPRDGYTVRHEARAGKRDSENSSMSAWPGGT
ncbi:MAG TPA: hypothetical protein VGS09_05600 [Actinomycetota bacterium]|nr:hypothetical protein [Actinomycetota bacterium]